MQFLEVKKSRFLLVFWEDNNDRVRTATTSVSKKEDKKITDFDKVCKVCGSRYPEFSFKM